MPVWFKRVLWALLALLLAYVVAVLLFRFRGPGPEARAALTLLERPVPPVAGRDGSDTLWLLDREIPAAERADAARRFREYRFARERLRRAGDPGAAKALPNPLATYPLRPPADASTPGLCDASGAGCLEFVRANRTAVDAQLKRQEGALEDLLALSSAEGLRSDGFSALSDQYLQYGSHRRLVPTYYAALFVRGQVQDALAGLCRDVTGWRRMSGDTDSLLASAVGARFVEHDLMLLSRLWAESPAGTALPTECDRALAPTTDAELDLCPVMRTEFRGFVAVLQESVAPSGSFMRDAIVATRRDYRAVADRVAPMYAQPCLPTALARMRADSPASVRAPPGTHCSTLENFFDPASCVLSEIALDSGAVQRQAEIRRLDLAQALALMRTLRWLRESGVAPELGPARLNLRPRELGLVRRPDLSDDGAVLSIPMKETSRGAHFELTLVAPPSTP